MKTLLSSALLLLAAQTVSAQYTRSLFYGGEGSAIYQSTMHPNSGSINVLSVGGSSEDTLRVDYQELDVSGNVTTARRVELIHSSIGSRTFLSGSFDEGNNVYTLVLINPQTTNTQQIGYVQLNVLTGTVVNSFFPTDLFRPGFSQTQLIGSDLVTYLISSPSGLQRISKPLAGFSSISMELADAVISASTQLPTGRKQSELLVYDGNEHLLITASSGALLFKRSSANNYTSVPIAAGGSPTRLIDLTVNGDNALVVAAGDSCFVMDAALNATGYLLTDPNYSINADGASEFFFHDGSYYRTRMSNSGTGSVSAISRFSPLFTYVSSQKLDRAHRIQSAQVSGTTVYLLGDIANSSYAQTIDAYGNPINLQSTAVFSRADNWPSVDPVIEYGQPFVQHDLRLTLGQGGMLFPRSHGNMAGAGLLVDDTLRSLVYSARSYFGAKNAGNNLVGMNTNAFESDLLTGPYTSSGNYSALLEAQYNRGFYVTRQMIDDHVAAIAASTPGYLPPHGIREWPAHGNTLIGQAANLAPFRDSDGDGTYEPAEGDYPLIYGDNCFLSIAHQGPDQENTSHIELHTYMYGFDCTADSAYLNTLFVKQLYIARGAQLDSLYAGVFMDGDLGNYNDDYIGTNVGLGLIYNYNADLYDDAANGNSGFGTTIPAHGILFLKGAKLANDGADNAIGIGNGETANGYGFGDGINDNEYYTLESSVSYTSTAPASQADPNNLAENFNGLLGLYRFGDPQRYCGPAADPSSAIVRYSYPAESDPLSYGSNGVAPNDYCSEEMILNAPGDRRITGATGKTTLAAGDTLEVVLAYVCAYEPSMTSTSLMDPVVNLFDYCSTIKTDFYNNAGPCSGNFGTVEENLSLNKQAKDPFTVYPNPTSDLFSIGGFGDASYTVSVYDINGRLLETATMNKLNNSLSLQPYSGSVFVVRIAGGTQTVVKRIVKN